MTFNIGSQQGSISNVAGNQTVYGGQNTNVGAPPEVLDAIRHLYLHLNDIPMSAADRAAAEHDVKSLDHQLATGEVSQQDVSHRLNRVLSAAHSAGAVLNAASSLGTAITTIAKWLGPLGASLIGFLV